MAKQPQNFATLTPYDRFVVEQIAKVSGDNESHVLAQMAAQWIVDHPDRIRDAGATLTEFQRTRGG
jgi:hypothetical protein